MDLEGGIRFLKYYGEDLISSEWDLLFDLTIIRISGQKSTHILSIIKGNLLKQL